MADRTWKLQNYLTVATLEEYVLVDAKALKMELYRREQNKWVYYMFGPDDELELSSVGLRFPVTKAYINVEFENESSPEEE